MTYSKRSQELAEKLAQKAANNLRKAGRIVQRDVVTGRYIVLPRTPRK